MSPVVDVIICTTCDRARGDSLMRAVTSLLEQEGAEARPLIVANGPRVDTGLLQRVAALPRVRIVRQEEGSLPRAIETGRRAVQAPVFAFLDDDDIYLPGALRLRLARLEADDRPDMVATDGYTVRPDGTRRQLFGSMQPYSGDPLVSLASTNWLSSCGGAFRTATIGTAAFTDIPKYFEWTSLAFRLTRDGARVGFVDTPTFAITETPGSLSRSMAYHRAAPAFVRGLLTEDLPPPVRRALRRKLSHLEHVVAERHLRAGNRWGALLHHLNSLASPYGFRHNASFTYRLVTGLPPKPA